MQLRPSLRNTLSLGADIAYRVSIRMIPACFASGATAADADKRIHGKEETPRLQSYLLRTYMTTLSCTKH